MYDLKRAKDYGFIVGFAEKSFELTDAPAQATALASSVLYVESVLRDDPEGFDGIGGMCDGGLIAAIVASRLAPGSRVRFLLNLCAMPWSNLPAGLGEALGGELAESIVLPSLHLIASEDEWVKEEERMALPARCVDARTISIKGGHVVPRCSASVANAVRMLVSSAGLVNLTAWLEST